MQVTFSIRRVLAAAIVSAAALTSPASAEYKGVDRVKAYGQFGAWKVSQHFTSKQSWCSARADYYSGERFVVIASKDDWALRVAHADWRGVVVGKTYDLDMRTDSGWSVGYRAWGYRSESDGYSGLAMPTFPGALKALAKAQSVYFIDLSGAVISALDLTGSAKAISSLHACREDLATGGSFDAPAPSALVAPAEVEAPAAPIDLTSEPAEGDASAPIATEMGAYAALTDGDLKPAEMKAPIADGAAPGGDEIAPEQEAALPEAGPVGGEITPEDVDAALEGEELPGDPALSPPEAEAAPSGDDITPEDVDAALEGVELPEDAALSPPEAEAAPSGDDITPEDVEAALEGEEIPEGEALVSPETERAPSGDDITPEDIEAALQGEDIPSDGTGPSNFEEEEAPQQR